MIRVIGNTIRIPRGDTGTLQLLLYTAQHTPYILPTGLTAPAFAVSVAKKNDSLGLGRNLSIAKFLSIPDYSTKYQFSQDIKTYGEDAPATGYVYAKSDGTFIYYTESSGTYTEHPYNFILTLPFYPADTSNLAPGNYRITVALIDSDVEAWNDETIDDGLSSINYKETIVETREFIVEVATFELDADPPGYQFYVCDPITDTLMPNAAPYLVITSALPVTVNLLPPGFANPLASAHSVGFAEAPTAEVSASGPYTNKLFSFAFGIPAGAPALSYRGTMNFNQSNMTYVGQIEDFEYDDFQRTPMLGDAFLVPVTNTSTGEQYIAYFVITALRPLVEEAEGECYFLSRVAGSKMYRGTVNAGSWTQVGNRYYYILTASTHKLFNPSVLEALVSTEDGYSNAFFSYTILANRNIEFVSDAAVAAKYILIGE